MKRKLLFSLIFLICIALISNVYASDTDDIAGDSNDTQSVIRSGVGDVNSEDVPLKESNVQDITVYIIDSNKNSSSDIQKTINLANDGDAIGLNGTFEFENPINIDKQIQIFGLKDKATIKKSTLSFSKFLYFNINASGVVLKNLKFSEGNSINNGIVNWCGNNGTIINCEFYSNNCKGTGFAGALFLKGVNCTIINSTFSNNYASQKGGAIVVEGKNNVISNCIFNCNEVYLADNSVLGGGAIFSDCDNLLITDCIFNNNNVREGNGGSVSINGKNNKIYNCSFNENSIKCVINSTIGGGAIYSSGDNLIINNSTFNKNNALNNSGGAICSDIPNTVENSFFNENYASCGNDIYSNSFSKVNGNNFIIENESSKANSVYGLSLSDLENDKNIFTVKKVESSVKFSQGMVFEYASSGSIHISVEGGTVYKENITVLNHPEAKINLKNNILTISNLAVGVYTLSVITTPDENHYSIESNLSVTVKKATAAIKASKLTVALKSGSTWKVKLVDSRNNKPIANMKVTLKIYTGKKYKTVNRYTNSKGEISYKTKSLKKGTHKVVISASHAGYKFTTVSSSIKVVKQKALKFKLRTKKDGNGGSLRSYIVINKKTKKAVNGIKIKILIYSGKKYKSYIFKSKKKGKYNGAFGFATNDFSAGKHKVKIKPVSIKYKGSLTTSIKIKKSATKGPKFFRKV